MTQVDYRNPETGEAQRPVPAWVGIAVVILCVAIGAAFLWWYFRDPLAGGQLVPDNSGNVTSGRTYSAPRQSRPVVRVSDTPVDGVKVSSETARATTYLVRSGTNLMEVEKASSGAETVHLRYNRRDLLTQEQRDLALVRFRVMQDQAMATELGVTEDQVAELKKIPTGAIEMEVSADDKTKLVDQFHEWLNGSDKSAAEKQLVAQLGAVGSSSFDATKAKVAERAAKIMTILKPEQIKKFNEMSNK